jgi:hypothetical protein
VQEEEEEDGCKEQRIREGGGGGGGGKRLKGERECIDEKRNPESHAKKNAAASCC